jgi:hypothetical protein
MTALAQISATFIAITAGFYTTKVISITNDKSRINGRIKELETERSIVEADSKTVQKQINLIEETDANEQVKMFFTSLLNDSMLGSFKIETVDDLIEIYKKYYERIPSNLVRKAIEEQLQAIVSKVSEEQQKQNLRNTVPITRIPSGEEQIVGAIMNQNEQDRYYNLIEKINSANSRLSVLKELLKVSRQELNTAIYPKHIKLGFISFIAFAVLGVFAPLAYNTWGEFISKVFLIPIDTNAFVLILFTAGLTLNFIYIGLEVRIVQSKG